MNIYVFKYCVSAKSSVPGHFIYLSKIWDFLIFIKKKKKTVFCMNIQFNKAVTLINRSSFTCSDHINIFLLEQMSSVSCRKWEVFDTSFAFSVELLWHIYLWNAVLLTSVLPLYTRYQTCLVNLICLPALWGWGYGTGYELLNEWQLMSVAQTRYHIFIFFLGIRFMLSADYQEHVPCDTVAGALILRPP